jgi:tRNA-specific 2-thiouridylase
MNALSHDLQIPMHIIDCKDYFKKNVIDYFTDAYNRGLTPNPCLVCNQRIKFGFLKDFIKTMGIKKMATGHYARTKYDLNGIVHLHINPDTIKDQSYFLAFLTQEQLSDVIFPLSDVTKAEVTAFIRKSGLRPITQPESQDICFIQSGSYKDFISGQADFSSRKGPVVLSDGQVIGHHNGLHGFTIGQRKGINCPGPYPYYVIEINTRSNTLLVGPKEQLLKKRCTVSSIQWISKPPDRYDSIITKIRYAHKGAESKLIIDENKNATIFFDTPQYAITPGQGAVFYRDGEVLGGGIINSA